MNEIINSILSNFDNITNHRLVKEINEHQPEKVIYENEFSAEGVKTIFDGAFRRACTQDNIFPLIDGSKSLANVTTLFLKKLILKKTITASISIKDVNAISSSREKLSEIKSLFDFGKKEYHKNKYRNQYETDNDFFTNILNQALNRGSFDFELNLLTSVLEWNNSDGSHRFATAYYIAKEKGYDFEIQANLTILQLNRVWVNLILNSYDCYMFQSNNSVHCIIFDLFNINSSSHSAICLNSKSPENSSLYFPGYDETTLLMLNKKTPLKGIKKRWLINNLNNNKVTSFSILYDELIKKEDAINKYWSKKITINP